MNNNLFMPQPRNFEYSQRIDLIVDEVKRWIMHGQLKPGDRLPKEAELEKLLDSSRGTVREALKILESQGLITIKRGPKGGAHISSVPYKNTSLALRNYLYFKPLTWANVYQVRQKLEPILAESVVDRLTESDIEDMKHTVELCELGVKGEIDAKSHRMAELEFHSILSRSCDNPFLSLICGFINDILRDLSILDSRNIISPKDSEFALEAIKYHSLLIEAFEQKDKARVQELMSEHVHCGGELVSQREEEIDQANLLLPQLIDTVQLHNLGLDQRLFGNHSDKDGKT